MEPSQIGRYEIQRRLGRGGMGSLYLARDPGLDRLVAIKIPKDDYLDDPEFRERFAREARALARLRHPNVIVIHDIGQHEGRPFMAMEYIDGETLRERLARPPLLPLSRGLELVESLCAGLASAHDAGIIHRDVKPENIMLDHEGVLKLLDFGIARAQSESMTQMTRPGMMMGTHGYMPPEQLLGGVVDHRSDLFAVGAVLYQVVARDPALFGTFSAAYQSILTTGSVPLAEHVAGVDPELVRIVTRALARDPEGRYQNANDMRQDLVRVRQRLSEGAGDLTEGQETVATFRAATPTIVRPVAQTRLREEMPPVHSPRETDGHEEAGRGRRRLTWVAVAVTAAIGVVAAFVWTLGKPSVPAVEKQEAPATSASVPARETTQVVSPPATPVAPPAAPAVPPPAASTPNTSVQAPEPRSPLPAAAGNSVPPPAAAAAASLPSPVTVPPAEAPRASQPRLIPFVDPARRFSIELPDDWRWMIVAGSGDPTTTFVQPNNEAAVVVERFRLRQRLSPADITDIFAEIEGEFVKENQRGVSNVVGRVVTRNGARGAIIDYNRPGLSEEERVRTYSFPIGEHLYRITGVAPSSRFRRYETDFDAVAGTLKSADQLPPVSASAVQGLVAAPVPPQRSFVGVSRISRPGFQLFTDPGLRFSIEHRGDWGWTIVAGAGEPIATFVPANNEAAVVVERFRLKQRLSPADITDLFAEIEAEFLKETQRGVSNLVARLVVRGDIRGAVIDYNRLGTKGQERVRMYSFPIGNDLYRITYLAAMNRFLQYEADFDALAWTLKSGDQLQRR